MSFLSMCFVVSFSLWSENSVFSGNITASSYSYGGITISYYTVVSFSSKTILTFPLQFLWFVLWQQFPIIIIYNFNLRYIIMGKKQAKNKKKNNNIFWTSKLIDQFNIRSTNYTNEYYQILFKNLRKL